MASQAVGFGKRIKLDQGVTPIRVLKQRMRRPVAAVKIALGFIDNECDFIAAAKIKEGLNNVCRIFNPTRIVWGH